MKNNLATQLEQSIDALELTKRIVQACEDAKGLDINVVEVSKIFGLADYFVFVTGRSDRQVQGICNRVLEQVTAELPGSVEGYEKGHWVLMDFSDVVVHIFYEPMREHYGLDSLWSKGTKVEL